MRSARRQLNARLGVFPPWLRVGWALLLVVIAGTGLVVKSGMTFKQNPVILLPESTDPRSLASDSVLGRREDFKPFCWQIPL